MADSKELKQLAAVFRRLGARKPESWARSQLEDGIPQLERFLFLRQAWRSVVAEDDPAWIDREIERAQQHSEAPYSGIGRALNAMRKAAVDDMDVIDLVRGAQAELLFRLCYLLEDPSLEEAELADINWSLMRLNDEDEPLEAI